MYTYTHCFCIFLIFQFFLYKKNEVKLKNNQTKHVKQDKEMHKTRLTQNNKVRHTSNAIKKREREKWINHLKPFSFYTLKEPFYLVNPWFDSEGEELKPFKFERNMRVLRRSPRGEKEDGNWFWSLDAIMLLLFWVANHL